MPSRRRCVSKTGFYHVMSRGNNKARIFNREKDYKKILQYVKRVVDDNSLQVYAYCIMPNHYHLLVRMPLKTTSPPMAKDGQELDILAPATAIHLSVSGLSYFLTTK